MNALKNECWFASERSASSSSCVDWGVLQSYVSRGRASTTSAVLQDGREVLSVSVRDASQGDVTSLPCGARSLLVEADTGAIVCRGVNKFFDLSEVCGDWLRAASLWEAAAYRVWVVRKMAGFVVTVFSLDGRSLEVMSKHALAGPHVDAARALLEKLDTAQMAADLFSLSASASFECIQRGDDHQHPVLEEALFDEQLVLIAVQRRDLLQERCVSLAALPAHAARWRAASAPSVQLTDSVALKSALRSVEGWRCVYAAFTECPVLAEGLVLVIESLAESDEDGGGGGGEPWCLPIRLKVKTPRYVVLRALRSLVMGDSRPQSFLYHEALLAWLAQTTPAEEMRSTLAGIGVSHLADRFEAALAAKGRLRYRDAADTVSHATAQLQAVSARAANPRSHCPLIVLVLCGLPGAGKTTVSRALLTGLRSNPVSSLRFAVHLSRDVVSRDAATAQGIDESSSKHKQRRLRALVHTALCEALRDVAVFSLETQQQGLLILDACNATQASRQVWRRCFPASLTSYQVVYVECPNAAVSAARVGDRVGHEVLHSAAEAQHALYTVRKKFQPPTAEESCWHVDTSVSAPDAAAGKLLHHVHQQLPEVPVQAAVGRGSGDDDSPRALDVSAIRAETVQRHTAMLRSLLDTSDSTAAQLRDVAAFLSERRTATATNASARRRRVQVRLNCAATTLRDVAAHVLCPTLGVSVAEPAGSLVSAGRRLVSRVASALWGGGRSADDTPVTVAAGSVARGQVKWLPGWLLHGKAVTTQSEVAAALEERFEQQPLAPHVTLLHGGGTTPLSDADIQRYLRDAGLHIGQEVTVCIESLLLDRHALCLRVTLDNGLSTQGAGTASKGEDGHVPLHVTVATVAGTSAIYAGAMFASFDVWQRENAALLSLQQSPQRQVNRSQSKFHNFVEYALETEVVLKGVVEVHQQ